MSDTIGAALILAVVVYVAMAFLDSTLGKIVAELKRIADALERANDHR